MSKNDKIDPFSRKHPLPWVATESSLTGFSPPPLKWRTILLDVHKAARFGITLYKLLRPRIKGLGTGADRSIPMIVSRWRICRHIDLLSYADNIVRHLNKKKLFHIKKVIFMKFL
nr:hypothetical protein [Fibrobacter sp. UWP2]